MVRLILVLVFGCCAQGYLSAQVALEYKVKYKGDHLLVEMQWQSEGKIATQLSFSPTNHGAAAPLRFHHFQSSSERHVTTCKPDSSQVNIYHPKGEIVGCSYEVYAQPKTMGQSSVSGPIIERDYFHVLGHQLFAFPFVYQQQTIKVTWEGFPAEWKILNSFGFDRTVQQISVSDAQWRESVFAGGQVSAREARVDGIKIRLCYMGVGLQDHALAFEEQVLQGLRVQRRFWNEGRTGQDFLAIFLPFPATDSNAATATADMSGIGTRNAFSVFIQRNKALNINHLRHLVWHELMHHWIGQELRMSPTSEMPDERWFIEGFTEYLSYLTEVESGALSRADFCEIANKRFFLPLAKSASLNTPSNRTGGYYLGPNDSEDHPYQIGFTYAWLLDTRLRCNSGQTAGLKDVLLDLMDQTNQRDPGQTEQKLLKLLVNQLGEEIEPIHFSVARSADQGILLDEMLRDDCHPFWSVQGAGGLPVALAKVE
jgi:predicted metalloprotease with PDZ domain